ncbi:MAG: 50S ribosomal protein L25/general stress protein Ctc [Bacteroidota bacterium]
MKSITINGSQRESVGKASTKALRNAGKVPCVLYGGDKPINFSAEELSFSNLVYTPNVYTAKIELENGEKFNAIMQDIQFHPVSDKILHIDFYQLHEDREVTFNIPVKLEGTAPGVINGGNLRFPNRKLKVRALPSNLPDFILADISKLDIGDKIYVSELKTGNYSFIHPDDMVVVQVRVSRLAMALDDIESEEGGDTDADEIPAALAEEPSDDSGEE